MKETKIYNNDDLLTLIYPSEREGYYLIKQELLDQYIRTDTLIDKNKILVLEGMSSNEKKAYRKGYKKGYRVAYAAVLRFIKLYSMASSAKLK